MWRSEDNLRCCSSEAITMLFETVVHWLEAHALGKADRPVRSGKSPEHWDYESMTPCMASFYMGSGDRTQILMLS